MAFIVLPDQQVPDALLRKTSDLGLEPVVDHPSGRPWVLAARGAAWSVVELGSGARAAMEGRMAEPIPDERLGPSAAALGSFDKIAEQVTRARHFLASADGEVRFQGSLSTDRQVFWATVHGVPVAADSIQVLHALVRSERDATSLALSLVVSLPVQPFAGRTPWKGIAGVGIGDWLLLRPGSAPRSVRWWTAPERDLDLGEAAGQVRVALEAALAESTAGRSVVSADLSGGLDSTSLCFLLHGLGADLRAFRTSSLNPANDETLRARAVAEGLGIDLQELAPLAESSSAFSLATDDRPASIAEGPLVWAASRGHLEELARVVAATGSSAHFTGLGGDELFDVVPGFYAGLWIESRSLTVKAALRAREERKTPVRPILFGASSRETYHERLGREARRIRERAAARSGDRYGWFPPVALPGWMSEHGRGLVAEALDDAASGGRPALGRDPVAQQTVESIAYQGSILRQFSEVLGEHGIDWRGPYTDARVVRAALRAPVSARSDDRVDKPVLAAAIGRAAPRGFYDKRGRGDFTTDIYAEHRRRREELAEAFGDSLLVETGLVDEEKTRSLVLEPSSADVGLVDVERIATAERWLRGIEGLRATDGME